MSLQIHDTRARSLVPLETREPGRISMYGCGPTVYNYVHIGNARTTLWYDLIRRYLGYRGYDVTYVMNYTDVDDKIIERSNIEGSDPQDVAGKYALAFERDMAALGVEPPDVLALATKHIQDMVAAIEGLIERDVAYEVDGDVFFAVERFEGYGRLSGRSLDDMRAGERIEPHVGKKYPLDFALWKAAKEGEPSWPSPWGRGRPGWHIECSVMSVKYLGMSFDIHTGGTDLIFPHHENEIAQAEALAGEEPFARHWLHTGMVQMGDTKMSKSLGNLALASDVLARYPGEVVRYWALGGSYRSQVTFSDGALADAQGAYQRWQTFLTAARHALGVDFPQPPDPSRRRVGSDRFDGDGEAYVQRFVDAMDDDFNSPQALAAIHDLVREGNGALEGAQSGDKNDARLLVALSEAFLEMTGVLGFDFPSDAVDSELLGGLIDYLLDLREEARSDKSFERADEIRDKLASLGVAIEDTSSGARWRISDGT
ncbi:MAG: cysteine--tRNA ligase [Actinomycetota bacterium]|nr:cysteine--tRNA ligase [Actinomycetota bacterium]